LEYSEVKAQQYLCTCGFIRDAKIPNIGSRPSVGEKEKEKKGRWLGRFGPERVDGREFGLAEKEKGGRQPC